MYSILVKNEAGQTLYKAKNTWLNFPRSGVLKFKTKVEAKKYIKENGLTQAEIFEIN